MAAGSTYTPIATQTVGSTVTTVTFSSITSSYTDLVLVCSAAISSIVDLRLRFNNDSGTNYSSTILFGNGTSAGSAAETSVNYGSIDYYGTPNTTLGGSTQIVQLMNYSNTTTYKSWLARANRANSGTEAIVGLYRSTSAISRIDISCYGSAATISAGSTFTLYGIAAA